MTDPCPIPAPLALPPGGMTCARLREWVREARAGARLPYASGPALKQCCAPVLVELVRKLADLDLVTAHFTRSGFDGVYLVVRTRRPVSPGMVL